MTSPNADDLIDVQRGPMTAVVWMNRPDMRNALSPALIQALSQAFAELDADPDVRAIVLAGRGKAFCAGADLNAMKAAASFTPEQNRADAGGLSSLMRQIYTSNKPVIARVHGPAFAGGMGLVACCDIAVASTDASFRLSEVRLGLIPAMISPYVVRAMGARHARRYALTAEVFDAAEAYRTGFVQELVPADELDATINVMLGELVQNGPQAMAACKQLMSDVSTARPDDDALAADLAGRIASQRASDEGREGLASFLEKRKPAWHPEA